MRQQADAEKDELYKQIGQLKVDLDRRRWIQTSRTTNAQIFAAFSLANTAIAGFSRRYSLFFRAIELMGGTARNGGTPAGIATIQPAPKGKAGL